MANVENITNWEKIQKGITETDRLISQKQYNLAMIKARQTLEHMVRCMAERACIADSDLVETIDQLYQARWISNTVCEHYHKIRMIGNRAVHEENDNAYEANQAYHLLSQEVHNFANHYNKTGRRPSSAQNRSSDRGRKRTRRKNGPDYTNLIRILLPVFCIIVLMFIILLKPGKDTSMGTPAQSDTVPVTETIQPTTIEVETETQSPKYKTSDILNVRKEPSTSGEKLGVLDPEVSIDFVNIYDDFWAVINYKGQKAYVARQFLIEE